MSTAQDTVAPDGLPGRAELIALLAMLFATIAFSIDAMLPALPDLSAALSPEAPNRAQLVVTLFMLGMGLGTFFTGPLSDSFGRRPVLMAGAALYIVSALVATQAQTLETLLAARLMMGLGAAAPRVVALAIIRDLYAGRAMAQIMSFVMMVFTLVPALAPSLGAVLIGFGGWHAVFYAFALFSALGLIWFVLRLPETLPESQRRPFRLNALGAAIREMMSHPVVRLSIIVQSFCMAMLIATISMIQPIYEAALGRGESFPLWFGLTAIVGASASYINARLVLRLGMRRLVTAMLWVQIGASAAATLLIAGGASGLLLFVVFLLWQQLLFFQVGMTLGNLNAIGMEPMGHIAGMAASIIGAVSTVVAVLLAVPAGLMFDGTPLPLVGSALIFALCAQLTMARLRRTAEPAAA
jgi:DHA1 family bicyclomycin/chloramphenicol resistance-like MFS transporter